MLPGISSAFALLLALGAAAHGQPLPAMPVAVAGPTLTVEDALAQDESLLFAACVDTDSTRCYSSDSLIRLSFSVDEDVAPTAEDRATLAGLFLRNEIYFHQRVRRLAEQIAQLQTQLRVRLEPQRVSSQTP